MFYVRRLAVGCNGGRRWWEAACDWLLGRTEFEGEVLIGCVSPTYAKLLGKMSTANFESKILTRIHDAVNPNPGFTVFFRYETAQKIFL